MKMTTRSLIGGIAIGGISTLALAFGLVDRAQAATLLNDNFNTENGGAVSNSTLSYTSFANWDVPSGNVDLIGNGITGASYDLYPTNGLYVDLNGVTSGTLTSKTSFSFLAGETATLSFAYGTNTPTTSADVFLGGVKIATVTNDTTNPSTFTNFSQTFSSPTSGFLSFVSTSPGSGGIVLDNIQLTSNAAPVPEPSDMLGTAIAFGSIVMLKRKLSKKTLG